MIEGTMAEQTSARDRFRLSSRTFEPGYLALHRSGELQRRAQAALERLADCRLCPRACGVDRLADKTAVCKTGRYAKVSSHFPHHGEEDCLRGWRGSGTIFFSQCNLRCVFCQNADISQAGFGHETTPKRLAEMMLELQMIGCHNINWVTPEHVVPQVLEALVLAAEAGLRLPIVYNTSAYDSLDSLSLLDGVVDIYMPDFKVWDEGVALKYLLARDYPEAARRAIAEMHGQVGPLKLDERGLACRGVLVRHLLMPGGLAGSDQVFRFLAQEVSSDTYINIMAQYHPAGRVGKGTFDEINRRITREEYRQAVQAAGRAGLWRLDSRAG
jgi:putative pyruvate formate lyase activating enzyme